MYRLCPGVTIHDPHLSSYTKSCEYVKADSFLGLLIHLYYPIVTQLEFKVDGCNHYAMRVLWSMRPSTCRLAAIS